MFYNHEQSSYFKTINDQRHSLMCLILIVLTWPSSLGCDNGLSFRYETFSFT